jgi:hypothetical protein
VRIRAIEIERDLRKLLLSDVLLRGGVLGIGTTFADALSSIDHSANDRARDDAEGDPKADVIERRTKRCS